MCARRIGERDIRPRLPAVTWQSIGEHIGADPARREPAAKLVSLLVDHHALIAAARRDQQRRAIGPHRAKDRQPRPRDMLDGAILEGVILAAIDDRSEEHTSELQSLMRISYAVFCL